MAGEQTNTQQGGSVDVNAIIAAAIANAGVSSGSNVVYLGGTSGTKTVRMKKTGQTVNIPVPRVTTIQEANSLYLNDPKLQANWRKTMQRNGLETGNPLIERKAWETAVTGASDWYTTSNGTARVTPEQYLQWWAGGQKKTAAPKLPSRSIYQYTPEQLAAKADEITRDLGGFTVTDEVKSKQWYKDLTKALNEMVMQGTVTTTKQVKNPKTGKMENVTIQKPEVTTEAITEKIKTAVKQADPESVARKQRIDNTKWLLSQGGQR